MFKRWLLRAGKRPWKAKKEKFHTCGGPRRRPCLGQGRGRRIKPELAVPMRGRSEHDPGTNERVPKPSAGQASPSIFPDAFCPAKHSMSCVRYLSKTDFVRDFLKIWKLKMPKRSLAVRSLGCLISWPWGLLAVRSLAVRPLGCEISRLWDLLAVRSLGCEISCAERSLGCGIPWLWDLLAVRSLGWETSWLWDLLAVRSLGCEISWQL